MVESLLVLVLVTNQQNDKAKQIYDSMIETYRSCQTYSDTGSLISGEDKLTFVTHFNRPTKFYFEFTEQTGDKNRFVLWCPGSAQPGTGAFLETHTWDTGDRKTKSKILGSAVAGFTGISSGAACNVPKLLLPGRISIGILDRMTDLVFVKTESIRNEPCEVIFSDIQDTKLWISQKSHLILRIEEKLGNINEVSEYFPSINGKVPDSKFIFTPPTLIN